MEQTTATSFHDRGIAAFNVLHGEREGVVTLPSGLQYKILTHLAVVNSPRIRTP